MADIKKLLETRKRLKLRKPFFLRQDKKRKTRVKGKWRRARGHQSKIREKRKGHINPPSTGYGAPRAVSGRDQAGRIPLVIENINGLARATKEHVVIVAAGVGTKKRVQLVEAAMKKGLTLSLKNPQNFIAEVAAGMKKRQDDRRLLFSEKEKKKKEGEQKAKEKAAEKKDPAEEVSEEERKKQEKKEIDQILTHTN
ncbi:MAG: eL32 family ribosomal protein [Candidatus Woesearchaeota archaeon]|nr:eL32 family ribosomal protein [Candidatus Woesearchaeota archaeon]